MDDTEKNRDQLIRELQELRQQVEHLQKSRVYQCEPAAEELSRCLRRAQALVNATKDFAFLVDPKGIFLGMNQKTADFYGESIEYLIGKSSLDIFPHDVSALRKIKLDEVVRNGAPVYFEDQHPGMTLAHSVYPVLDSRGNVEAVAAYVRDISEQRRMEEGLKRSAEMLERRVAERTAELSSTVEKLAQEISQRTSVQEALKAEKRRFQALVENSPFGIVLLSDAGNVDYVNPWCTEVTGYTHEDIPTREELLAKAYPDPAQKKRESAAWETYLKSALPGQVISRTTVIRCKDGPDKTVSLHHVVIDESLRLMAFEDVSDRKRWEEDLRESKKTIEALINAVTDRLYLLDSNGMILLANRAVADVHGMQLDEVLGRSIFDLMPSDATISRMKCLDEVFKTGKEIRLHEEYADRVFETSLWPAYETDGKTLSVAVYVRDITDRSLAEKATRTAEERYRRLVELTPYGTAITSNSKVVFLNRALASLVGVDDPEEVIGRSFWDFLHPDYHSVVEKRLSRVLQHGEAVPTNEEKLIRMDGKVIDVEVTAIPFTYRGKPAVQAVFNDVTERKQSERRIKSSLAEKEVLLREIHHRVKNNLQIMSSLLRLQSRHVKDKSCEAILQGAENRVRSMALIHEKLYQSDRLTNLDFKRYVEGLVSFLVTAYEISKNRVKVMIDVPRATFGVDTAGPLGFILTELISNCLEHAFVHNEHGEIQISLVPIASHEYELSVQDNGVGIARDVNFKLPQSLGLDLVSTFAQQLRGTVQFNSDHGTEVVVRFKDIPGEKNS